jgi:hypothetical protein
VGWWLEGPSAHFFGTMRIREKESDILRAILDLLAAEGVFAIRLNTGCGWANGRPIQHHSGGAGTADILAFPRWLRLPHGASISPSVLWIEVKSATGKQGPEQISFQRRVEEEYHYYLVARSVDDVRKWLKGDR